MSACQSCRLFIVPFLVMTACFAVLFESGAAGLIAQVKAADGDGQPAIMEVQASVLQLIKRKPQNDTTDPAFSYGEMKLQITLPEGVAKPSVWGDVRITTAASDADKDLIRAEGSGVMGNTATPDEMKADWRKRTFDLPIFLRKPSHNAKTLSVSGSFSFVYRNDLKTHEVANFKKKKNETIFNEGGLKLTPSYFGGSGFWLKVGDGEADIIDKVEVLKADGTALGSARLNYDIDASSHKITLIIVLIEEEIPDDAKLRITYSSRTERKLFRFAIKDAKYDN